MNKVKLFEVRDRMTFIPVLALCVDMHDMEMPVAERFLLRRVGYGANRCVIFTRLAADGQLCHYDPWGWGDRTMHVAHRYVLEEWDELASGDVIDVEFILGDTTSPKASEMVDAGVT